VLSGPSTITEGGLVTYIATLTGTAGVSIQDAVSVDYKTRDGSAKASTDYISSTGTLTFAAGAVSGTTQPFTVKTTDDKLVEAPETYTASISNLSTAAGAGVSIDTAGIVTTITDNDQLRIVLSGPSTVTEGGDVTYIATLTGTAGVSIQDAVSVDYKTADGSAKAGTDYISSTGTLTFAAGAVSGATQPFTVKTVDDKLVEAPETYTASISNLSTAAGAGISIDTTGIVTTITDNDQLRIVLSGPSTVTEGGDVTYLATLTGTAGVSIQDAVSVDYKTRDGSAKAGTDYISSTGTLTFAAGAVSGTTQPFTVNTTDDKLVEAPETYTASISNVVGPLSHRYRRDCYHNNR
jgi:hypothetical protein